MDEQRRQLVAQWMQKAERDLASTERLAGGDEPILETAAYHCQQAAEKSLKALLVAHDRPVPKTHDLTVLLARLIPLEPSLDGLQDATERLAPFATLFRYPGDVIDPETEEYAAAYQATRTVIEQVQTILDTH